MRHDELTIILDHIVNGQPTDADIETLRQLLVSGDRQLMLQLGKFNVNIGEGKDIHIGDRIYQSVDVEKIREILVEILQTQDRDLAPLSTKTRQQYLIEQRNRKILLDIVYSSWVDDSLKQSLYCEIQIKLGLEKRQDAVGSTWGRLGNPRQVLSQGTRIIDQFKSLATGRLLILGQAGAGKTTALVELAKDLIEQAKENSELPIPVVFHLSTWKIPKQSLKEWLIAELSSKYDFKEVITVPWIESQQILLLLDGLDEVHSDWQEDCIKSINKFSQDYGQTHMVVCSRLDDYEKLSGQLRCDMALVIQPLNSKQIDQYFQDLQEASGVNVQAIRLAVQTDLIMAELAKTPLFLWIMSLLYKGKSPAEIPQEQNTEEVKQLLFSQYLDRMAEPPDRGQRYPYPQTNKKQSNQDKSSRTYTKEETLAWLQFLAKRLNRESNSIFLIEQLNPKWLPSNVSPWLYRLGVGLAAGLIIEWFYGLPLGIIDALLSFQMLSGLFAGLSLGMIGSMNSDIKLFDSLGWSWSWSRAFKAIIPSVLSIPVMTLSLLLASLFSIVPSALREPLIIIILGIFTGLVSGIISGCVAGLVETKHKSKDTQESITNQGIWRSAQKSTGATLFALIVLILPISFSSNFFIPLSIVWGCIGLYVGGLSSIQHFTIRILLWKTNNAPWDYTNFLNYATERLLIKRVGGGYLFIHELLQQTLANQNNKVKNNKQPYSQGIVFGLVVGVICLISILIPTTFNSWQVSSKQAILYNYNLKEGDRLITDLFFYRLLKLKSGDIITFRPMPEMPVIIVNSEVIACPSDTVSIEKSKIILNGTPLNRSAKMHLDISEYNPIKIPDNSYLIITQTNDKKNIPLIVPASSIVEKAVLRIWPTFKLI